MTHLDEKITDFVFGELSAEAMEEARRHLGECSDCRFEVEKMQQMHMLLKALPDQEPPRTIVFAPPRRSWVPSWLTPVAAAAALAVALLTYFQPAPASVASYEPLIAELRSRAAKNETAVLQLRGQLAYFESLQRTVQKETMQNSSYIQQLAQK